ncbi:MAG TPA: ABC transporter ATP-binding protein [Rhizobacter sp.]
MPPPLLSLDHVDKRYASGVQALRDVSLAVGPHEFVSLLGPSGCGKSSVLRLVAGLDTASAGTVSAPALGGSAADTACVFQDATLMPWASVFDNVWLPLRIAGQSRAQAAARVEEALARVGLTDFARARPAELSGGMKMRASIARALVAQPRVLLMDEPFAALDEFTRQKLNDDLLHWWQAGTLAVLFVTHSIDEAAYLSQRVLVMSARPGQIVDEVAIDEPYPRRPAFRRSATFLSVCERIGQALETSRMPG